MKKLKERWGIHSNFQVIVILVVFAVTGSTASVIGKPILSYLNITSETFNPVLVLDHADYFAFYCLPIFIGWFWMVIRAIPLFLEF